MSDLACDVLVQRLTDRYGLDPIEAHAAVIRARLGVTGGPHEQLVRDEAQAVLNEVHAAFAARAVELMRSITEALRPLGEATHAAMAITRADFKLCPPEPRAPDFPSPTGPEQP